MIYKTSLMVWGKEKVTNHTILILTFIISMAVILGAITAYIPFWIASFSVGIPILLLVIIPKYRFWAVLVIFILAPFMPYMKAFTGVRYGPLVLDLAILLAFISAYTERIINRKPLRLSWIDFLVIAFLAFGMLQIFNPLGPGLVVAVEGFRILVWQAIGFLLVKQVVETRKQVRSVIVVLLVVAVLVGLFGIIQSFFPTIYDERIIFSTIGDPTTYTSLTQRRAFSTMSSPAHLGYFMIAAILLGVALLSLTRYRFWLIVAIAIMGFALMLTIVRTAWVGLASGFVLFGLLRTLRRKKFVTAIRYLIVGILILILLTYVLETYGPALTITKRFLSLSAPTQEYNYQIRVESWFDTIIPAILANPLGYGVGSDTTSSAALFYSHNGYFYILIELGVVGLILVITILAMALWKGLRSYFELRDPFLQAIAGWTIAFWGAVFVMATVGALLEVYPVMLYAWFFLGLLDILPELDTAPRASETQSLD